MSFSCVCSDERGQDTLLVPIGSLSRSQAKQNGERGDSREVGVDVFGVNFRSPNIACMQLCLLTAACH